jgi:hypothetical protein
LEGWVYYSGFISTRPAKERLKEWLEVRENKGKFLIKDVKN